MGGRRTGWRVSVCAVGLLAVLGSAVPASAQLLGPLPYVAFDESVPGHGGAVSPFSDLGFLWFHLEDFEDGALSTPGVSASPAAVLSGAFTDSVDADDGAIDGSGAGGHSLVANVFGEGVTEVSFSFDAGVLGELPTHVGVVWTDGAVPPALTTFEAFDEQGDSLGTIGPVGISDGGDSGGTAEDRFFGVVHAGGISEILIQNPPLGLEVDHLQYGYLGSSQPITVGVPVDALLDEADAQRVYWFDPTPGRSLSITLTDPDPGDANVLYLRWGSPPRPWAFDLAADLAASSGQKLCVPVTRADRCYLLVLATELGGTANDVRLLVEETPVSLESTTLREASTGGTGLVSAGVRGAGLDATCEFFLLDAADGAALPAVETTVVSSGRAELVFDLSAAPAGDRSYHLRVEKEGDSGQLDDALSLRGAGSPPLVEAELTGPDLYRYRRLTRFTLRYRNSGLTECAAPVFRISGPEGTELGLAATGEVKTGPLYLMGIHRGGVAGRLAPGAEGAVAILLRSEHCLDCDITLQVERFVPRRASFVGWDRIDPPDGLDAEAWQILWPRLSSRLGGSWREVQDSLAGIATRLARRGDPAASLLDLYRFAAREALARPTAAALGTVRLEGSLAPIAGAQVVALVDGEVISHAGTDAEGAYSLDWLAPGTEYDLGVVDHAIVASGSVSRVLVPETGDVYDVDLVVRPEANALTPTCPACDESDLPTQPIEPPPELFAPAGRKAVRIRSSWDPNEKEGSKSDPKVKPPPICWDGPLPEDHDGWVEAGDEILYEIYFENLETASLPAQEVRIRDVLPESLDASTLRLESVRIGGAENPLLLLDLAGRDRFSHYTVSATRELTMAQRLLAVSQEIIDPEGGGSDVRELLVELDVRYQPTTRQLVWDFRSLTDEVDVGFLLPNDAEQQGEGMVSFSVRARKDVEEGAKCVNPIYNRFDQNDEVFATSTHRITHCPGVAEPAWSFPGAPSGTTLPLVDPDTALRWDSGGSETHDLLVWLKGQEPELVAQDLQRSGYRPEEGWVAGGQYYWQVIARRGDASEASEILAFQVVEPPSAPPAIPCAVTPEPGQRVETLEPLLSWDATGAVAYDVYLWPLGEVRPDRPIASGIEGDEFLVTEPLDPDTDYQWTVLARAGDLVSEPERVWRLTTATSLPFRRGDADASGSLDITDPIVILGYLFLGDPEPPCVLAADGDDSGNVDISDAIGLLGHLFLGEPAPPPPSAECGRDPTPDGLGCGSFPPCDS